MTNAEAIEKTETIEKTEAVEKNEAIKENMRSAGLRLVKEWVHNRPRVRVDPDDVFRTLSDDSILEELAQADRWLTENPKATIIGGFEWDEHRHFWELAERERFAAKRYDEAQRRYWEASAGGNIF